MNNVIPINRPDPELRTPPSNVQAERALLGAILLNNKSLDHVLDFLKPEMFTDPAAERVYAAIVKLIENGSSSTVISLQTYLETDEILIAAGGVKYLAALSSPTSIGSAVRDYGEIIKDLWMRRQIIGLGQSMVEDAFNTDIENTASMVLESGEEQLFSLGASTERYNSLSTIESAGEQAVDIAEIAHKRDGGLSGLTTGLADLDRQLGGLHPSDLFILAGRPSMGKAQPLTSKVLLADGTWKAMGDLRLGDDLASIDGAPSRVAGVFPQGVRKVYRITLGDGRSTRACGEHLWQIESSKFEGQKTVTTDDLRKMLSAERYQRRVTLPLVSGHFGRDEGLLVDPWLLGAMIGNGCMSSGHLAISTMDAATLFRVQNVVGQDCVAATDTDYDYRITNGGEVHLRDKLRALGLYGKKSEEKFIPAAYLAASRQSRLELLRGLLDTDGWVEKIGVVRYSTASPKLAEDLQALVRSLGGSCTINTKVPVFTGPAGEKKQGQLAYICNLRHPDRASLLTLKRKQRRCENVARFKSPTIVSVEPDGIEETQCIRVTHPSSLYVTDDYIVTHNTALATAIAYNAAKYYRDTTREEDQGKQVIFFSLEMSAAQLATRILAHIANVDSHRIRTGRLSNDEFARLIEAKNELAGLPLQIDDQPAATVNAIRTRCRRLARKKGSKGVGAVVVDYLQLMAPSRDSVNENRTQQLGGMTRGLKAIAKDLNVPVLALSQLSRAVEQRDDKRPMLSDLRESGTIEQDSDGVMFVYREEYYLERSQPQQKAEETAEKFHERFNRYTEKLEQVQGIAEVITAKQRHGPIGTVRLHFDAPTTWFSDLAKDTPYMQGMD